MSDVSSDEYPEAQINKGDLSDSSFSDNEEVVKEEVKVEPPKPKPKPKRVMSEKQKASLEKGRATAAANRLARKKAKEDAAKVKAEVVKIKEVEPEPEVVPEVAPPKKPKKKLKRRNRPHRPAVAVRVVAVKRNSLFYLNVRPNPKEFMKIYHHLFILFNFPSLHMRM